MHLIWDLGALQWAEETCLRKKKLQVLRLCGVEDHGAVQDLKEGLGCGKLYPRLYNNYILTAMRGRRRFLHERITWPELHFLFSIIKILKGSPTYRKLVSVRNEPVTFFGGPLKCSLVTYCLQIHLVCIFDKQDILLCNHSTTTTIRKIILIH